MNRALLYDGRSAAGAVAELGREGDDLLLAIFPNAGGDPAVERLPALRLLDRRDDVRTFGRADVPEWRLALTGPTSPDVEALLPTRRAAVEWLDRVGLLPAITGGVLAFAAIGFLLWHLPSLLAPLVPQSWADRAGAYVVRVFEQQGKACNEPAGVQALDRLAARLRPDGAHPLTVHVNAAPWSNALAAPGGHIVIMKGLIDEAESPDEVAGVLAHEIGHAERRHPTRSMIQSLGIGVIFQGLGGDMGSLAQFAYSLSYSRNAEEEADEIAIALLERADISPLPLADFFGRLAEREAWAAQWRPAMRYLSTHPVSEERETRVRSSVDPNRSYTPAMSDAEWAAVRAMCTDEADSEPQAQ